jgi:hypothetical protein
LSSSINLAECAVECAAVARGHGRRWIDLKFAVIRRKPFAPSRFSLVIEHRLGVAEETEIDRLCSVRADFSQLLADLIGIEHRAWERAEGTGLRRCRSQFPVHGTGHWRLHDRHLDPEKLEEATVWPHIRTIFRDLSPLKIGLMRA